MAIAAQVQEEQSFDDQNLTDLLSDVVLDTKRPLAPQIFSVLKQLILTLRLLPSQAISEKQVAKVLSASKTPVREAMIRLEEAGLVNVVPQSGTYVAPLEVDRFFAACFIRRQLETGSVRAAAQHENRARICKSLETLVELQVQAFSIEDYIRFFELDDQFHKSLFELTGLPSVWETIQRTQVDVHRIRQLRRIKKVRNCQKVIDDHLAIITAVRSGSADRAEAAMLAHIGPIAAKFGDQVDHPDFIETIKALNTTRPRMRKRTISKIK